MTMGAQIPVIAEKSLAVCGYKKFQLAALGDHLCDEEYEKQSWEP